MILGIDFKKLINSFKNAFSGIKTIFEEEQVFKIMFFIAILAIIAMFYFHLVPIQKILLFTLIILVLVLELLNSIIEKVLNFVSPGFDEKVKVIKNVMAGIVLLTCLVTAVIGILIFLPYFK